jgi:plasmid maintenance system antidote protein VapI
MAPPKMLRSSIITEGGKAMIRIAPNREPQHHGEVLREDYLIPLGMTPDTALRLEKLCGQSAQSWLNAQLRWDLWHAMQAPVVKRAVAKIRPIETAA